MFFANQGMCFHWDAAEHIPFHFLLNLLNFFEKPVTDNKL